MINFRRIISKIRAAILNPFDLKYLLNQPVHNDGIVLCIHESKRLGTSLLVLHLASELVKQGENVFIITRTFGELNKEYSLFGSTQIAVTNLDIWRILRRLKKYGYNRLLVVSAASSCYVPIGKREGYKIVSLIHEMPAVISELKLKKTTRTMLEVSDTVVFPTSISKKGILSMLNVPDRGYLIHSQGIYYQKPSLVVIENERRKLLLRCNITKDRRVVLGVGNTCELKGFDLFVSTAKLFPEAYFLWAGIKENYYKGIACNAPKNFIYIGELNRDELAGAYSASDVLLLSSRKDTLPSVIFEALLFGVPVIGASDSGGIVDIINMNNGYLTETSDANQFAIALKCILNSEELERRKTYIINNTNIESLKDYATFVKHCFDK